MIANGTRIKCTDHGGKHTGTVVQQLGADYAVAWDNAPRPMAKTPEQKDVAANHKQHFVSCPPAAIEEA